MTYLQKYRLKFIIGATSIITVLIVVFGIVVYYITGNITETQLSLTARSLAFTAGKLIEENIEEYAEFIKNPDSSSQYYKDMNKKFVSIKAASNIKFIYTMIKYDEGHGIYIIDGEIPDSENYSAPGDITELNQFIKDAFEADKPTRSKLEKVDEYGIILTATAPIFNKLTGEKLGIICVDISIENYHKLLTYLFYTMIIVIIFIIIVAVILSYAISDNFTRPVLTDFLTKVYNKHFFEKRLKFLHKSSSKTNFPLTVLMIDLDHFKSINDCYGHTFGDKVLIEISKTISDTLRKHDLFARYGGEEFIIALPGTDIEKAFTTAERIKDAVLKTKVINNEIGKEVSVTVSIGIASYKNGQTMHELIECADKALYAAKIRRNDISIYKTL